jgi:hypothetical protein
MYRGGANHERLGDAAAQPALYGGDESKADRGVGGEQASAVEGGADGGRGTEVCCPGGAAAEVHEGRTCTIMSKQTIRGRNLLVDAPVRSPVFAACSLHTTEALKHTRLSPVADAPRWPPAPPHFRSLWSGQTHLNCMRSRLHPAANPSTLVILSGAKAAYRKQRCYWWKAGNRFGQLSPYLAHGRRTK